MQVTDRTYYVSEVFESIQGEGNYAGVNALFIRFQLCNLTCSWCDTKYTWTRFSGESAVQSAEQIKETIKHSGKKHIIFTGGEPAIYRLDLLTSEPDLQYHVETNGTIIPTREYSSTLRDGVNIHRDAMQEHVIKHFNWVVSPKLSNAKQQFNKEILRFWIDKPWVIFKFIVDKKEDFNELEDLIQELDINTGKVYVGLQGISAKSVLRKDLMEEIITRGYHFSPRLHILFWGNERGK